MCAFIFINKLEMMNKDEAIQNDDNLVDEQEVVDSSEIVETQESVQEDEKEKIITLEAQIMILQQELKKFQEIATQTQSQYLNLKYDFDAFHRRVEREKDDLNIKMLIDNISNFLPFIENLRKSIQEVPSDIESNNWVKWVALLYATLIKRLEEMWVYEIDCIWLEPDAECHEPISMQSVDQDELKWKIIQECERGFIYKKWDKKIVIRPSRVIVWG